MKKIWIGIAICILIISAVLWSVLVKSVIAQVKTIEIAKISTSLVMSNGEGQGKYSITLGCNLMLDGVAQGLDLDAEPPQEYLFIRSADYAMGASVSGVYQDFEDVFQADIDEWNAEQAIQNHAQLSTIVTTLQSNLSW